MYLQIAHLAVHASDNKDPLEVRDVKEINLKFGHIKNIKRRKFAGVKDYFLIYKFCMIIINYCDCNYLLNF